MLSEAYVNEDVCKKSFDVAQMWKDLKCQIRQALF